MTRDKAKKTLATAKTVDEIDAVYEGMRGTLFMGNNKQWIDRWYAIYRGRLERGGIVRVPAKIARLLKYSAMEGRVYSPDFVVGYARVRGDLCVTVNGVTLTAVRSQEFVGHDGEFYIDRVGNYLYPIDPDHEFPFPDVSPLIDGDAHPYRAVAIGVCADEALELIRYAPCDGGEFEYVDRDLVDRLLVKKFDRACVVRLKRARSRCAFKFSSGMRGGVFRYDIFIAGMDPDPIESEIGQRTISWKLLAEV